MRLRNNIFAEAFKWLKKNWDGIKYQKDVAAKVGVSEDTITRIMRDQTEVTDDFLCKFNEAFNNVFNYQWLRGEDPLHMLTVDLIEAKAEPYIDPSSQTNATISAYIEAIESLKRELRTKDDLLAEKDDRLTEKDERIAELKAHNIDLRRQLDQYQNADVDRYPFPVGAADGNKLKTARK